MNIYKKLLIGIVFILLFYILFRLLQKRNQLLMEGFDAKTGSLLKDPDVIAIQTDNHVPVNLTSVLPINLNEPLNTLVIKSSMHSAYTGKTISTDMILYVLSRGYRFLDFEVHYMIPTPSKDPNETVITGSKAVVGYSIDGQYPSSSNNQILLSSCLNTVLLNAFKTPSPNSSDPIFIQIRPMYQKINPSDNEEAQNVKKANNTKLNQEIETALAILDPVLYKGTISPTIPIKKLMGKAVIIMDSNSSNSNQKSKTLTSKINIDFFGTSMIVSNYGELKEKSFLSNHPILTEIMLYDNKNSILTYIPETSDVVKQNILFNIFPVMAWMSSSPIGMSSLGFSGLGNYENMFNSAGGTAFLKQSEVKSM